MQFAIRLRWNNRFQNICECVWVCEFVNKYLWSLISEWRKHHCQVIVYCSKNRNIHCRLQRIAYISRTIIFQVFSDTWDLLTLPTSVWHNIRKTRSLLLALYDWWAHSRCAPAVTPRTPKRTNNKPKIIISSKKTPQYRGNNLLHKFIAFFLLHFPKDDL